MQLIGMLDSPYVRRVAVSLQLLDLHVEHVPVSVFGEFETFREINAVVKAPSLVCDDGMVLMDSTLILDYLERLAPPDRALMPFGYLERQHALRIVGLALVACEKSVQIIYERSLRPADKRHQPWIERISGQLLAACIALQSEFVRKPERFWGKPISQAGITTAVAWRFAREMLPEIVDASAFPALEDFSAWAERLAEFAAAPHGSGQMQELLRS